MFSRGKLTFTRVEPVFHLGDASPLDKDKMTKLSAALGIAVPQNQAAKDADAVAQKARQTRDQALGTADGQTLTPRTRR